MLISAKNVSVERDQKAILRDVSLDVKPKDFVTIIGPNGAGKSMLLKCLLGFYKPDSGQVVRQEGLRIGYVPQRLVADHTMPLQVQRFLTLGIKPPREVMTQVTQETATDELLKKPIYVLSGGELQRVLLARALLHQPELLVLDEPAQNLDVPGQLAFYKLLDQIYLERDISILMVSHDLHLVMSSTKQVVCLFHHICCSGEPQTVTKDPEFVSLFGDDMARMMAVYHHDHEHVHDEALSGRD